MNSERLYRYSKRYSRCCCKSLLKPVVKKEPKVVPVGDDDIDKDYAYQRQNFYSLIERGQDAIDGILDIAREVNTQEHTKWLDN